MKEIEAADLDERLRAFLSEDVGRADVTTETTVPSATRTRGELVAKSACVGSGHSGCAARRASGCCVLSRTISRSENCS